MTRSSSTTSSGPTTSSSSTMRPPPARRVGAAAWGLLRQAAVEWWNDDTFQLSAALAFYTVFSLAPMVVIAVAVAGAIFGAEQATNELIAQVESLIGSAGGRAVRAVLDNAQTSGGGPIATFLGIAAVAIGSTAVFAQLQTALNRIWDVKAVAGRGMIASLIRDRLLGMALAVGAGFLLMVSLVLRAMLSATEAVLANGIPAWGWFWGVTEAGVSFLLVAGLYMTIYKVLPDARIAWRDVVVGALVTSALFSLGKYFIGLYLGRMSVGDVYGAAGSLVVLLVWVYYTALVSFFGAEFTQVYARRYGSHIRPAEYAVRRGGGKPAAEPPEE